MHFMPVKSLGCATTLVIGLLFNAAPIAQAQSLSILYSFGSHSADGANPVGGLVLDPRGNLYGTTYYGGAHSCTGLGCGTVTP